MRIENKQLMPTRTALQSLLGTYYVAMNEMLKLLLVGPRTIGGLQRAGIEDPLKIAKENPGMFLISDPAVAGATPVISLIL